MQLQVHVCDCVYMKSTCTCMLHILYIIITFHGATVLLYSCTWCTFALRLIFSTSISVSIFMQSVWQAVSLSLTTPLLKSVSGLCCCCTLICSFCFFFTFSMLSKCSLIALSHEEQQTEPTH